MCVFRLSLDIPALVCLFDDAVSYAATVSMLLLEIAVLIFKSVLVLCRPQQRTGSEG